MIQTQRNKCEDRTPHCHNLGVEIFALHYKVARQANEPVTPNAPKEDLVELGLDLFGREKLDGSRPVGPTVKHATVC